VDLEYSYPGREVVRVAYKKKKISDNEKERVPSSALQGSRQEH
jgi:hypothetical protein